MKPKNLHEAPPEMSFWAFFFEVILVGGSTRIPAVQDLARELTAFKPINMSINQDEALRISPRSTDHLDDSIISYIYTNITRFF